MKERKKVKKVKKESKEKKTSPTYDADPVVVENQGEGGVRRGWVGGGRGRGSGEGKGKGGHFSDFRFLDFGFWGVVGKGCWKGPKDNRI